MSAIAAIFRTDGAPPAPGLLAAMSAAMAFRSHDGIGQWEEGAAAIGQGLFRTTPDAPAKADPLVGAEGSLVIAFDGFLANFDELRRDLSQRGCQLRNPGDAELALCAFAVWGEECAAKLEGEFAFVIWDKNRQRVFCARDHLGLRPLLYHWDGVQLTIASEPAAIIAALPAKPAINCDYVAEIAVDTFFSADATIWQGIRQLLPAHTMQLANGAVNFSEYWHLQPGPVQFHRDERDYCEEYRFTLSDCVRRASRSLAPVACEVSGGLDSSALFCLAHGLHVAGNLPAPDIMGYTLAGPAGSNADELQYAHAVAEHCGRDIAEIPLFMPEPDWYAKGAARNADMPVYPNGAMAMELQRKAAADGCRVLINGTGGDDWLDGTSFYYRELFEARQWAVLAQILRADVSAYGPKRALSYFLRLGPGSYLPQRLRRLRQSRRTRDAEEFHKAIALLRPHWRALIEHKREEEEQRLPGEYRDTYKQRKVLSARWSRIIDLADRQRAHNGLERRSPYLSRQFIEYIARVPQHMLLRGGERKYLHRQALLGVLPGQVACRASKADFNIAFYALESGIAQHLRSDNQGPIAQLADPDALSALLAEYEAAKIDEKPIWRLWGAYAMSLILRMPGDISEEDSRR